MKFAFLFLIAVIGLSPMASAEIVFSMTPLNSTIAPGDTQQFQVRVNSTLALGEQVNALEFNAIAGPGNGIGGTFVAPSTLVILDVTSPIELSTPGQALGSSFLSSGALVTNSGIVLANLFLSTVGATQGTYSFSFDQLLANSPTLAGLQTSAGPTTSYTIGLTAVPEPTSMLTAAMLGGVGMFYRRRGSKATFVRNRRQVKSKR